MTKIKLFDNRVVTTPYQDGYAYKAAQNIAARDAILADHRFPGLRVWTVEEKTEWELDEDLVTWYQHRAPNAELTASLNSAFAQAHLYVRTTGNDVTGNGLTVATAFATLQRALQEIGPEAIGFLDINFGPGTFTLPEYLHAAYGEGLTVACIGDTTSAPSASFVPAIAGVRAVNPSGGNYYGSAQFSGLGVLPALSDGSHWIETQVDAGGGLFYTDSPGVLDGDLCNGPGGIVAISTINPLTGLTLGTTYRLRPYATVFVTSGNTLSSKCVDEKRLKFIGCQLGATTGTFALLGNAMLAGCYVRGTSGGIRLENVRVQGATFERTVTFNYHNSEGLYDRGAIFLMNCSVATSEDIFWSNMIFKGTSPQFQVGTGIPSSLAPVQISAWATDFDFRRSSAEPTTIAMSLLHSHAVICDDGGGLAFHNIGHAVYLGNNAHLKLDGQSPGLTGATQGVCLQVGDNSQVLGFAGLTTIDNAAAPGTNIQFIPSGRTYSWADISSLGGIVDINTLSRVVTSTGGGNVDNRATVLTYAASVALDFTGTLSPNRRITLAGDITFTTSNVRSGGTVSVRIDSDATQRSLVFPSAWNWLGTMPTSIGANDTAELTIRSFGTTNADILAQFELNDLGLTRAELDTIVDGYQKLSEKNVANGYAPLDANGRLPYANYQQLGGAGIGRLIGRISGGGDGPGAPFEITVPNGGILIDGSAQLVRAAITGDVTAQQGSSSTILSNTAVVAGAYTLANLTVDAKGRLIGASSGNQNNLLPAVDDGYSIGSAQLKWADGYFGGNVVADGYVQTGLYVEFIEGTEPTIPADGFGRLYEKTNGKLYFKNDLGVETDLSGGGEVTEAELDTILDGYQKLSQKNIANGYAPLDSNAQLPYANYQQIATGGVHRIIGRHGGAGTGPPHEILIPSNGGINIDSSNQLYRPALIGDVTAGDYSNVTTLSTTGVTAGSYAFASIVVDAKGRIGSATNGNLDGYALTTLANLTTTAISVADGYVQIGDGYSDQLLINGYIQRPPSGLAYATTININFASASIQSVSLAGNVTFTSSNLAAGRTVTVKISADGSTRNLTFPAWKFVGAAAPTSIAAGKTALLSLIAFDTSDSAVVGAYSVEP